jgi:hypothetical protein
MWSTLGLGRQGGKASFRVRTSLSLPLSDGSVPVRDRQGIAAIRQFPPDTNSSPLVCSAIWKIELPVVLRRSYTVYRSVETGCMK